MADFVHRNSIVREIWGDSDTILLIFAGSAAEFALNRAVDWLFYTNRLPSDPIGRLFSTARYAQEIVFADESRARQTLARINAAHDAVENRRGHRIPEWAYRDVLYMLIDYSIRSYELLRRPLEAAEREDLYDTFYRVGEGMQIPELPPNYSAWLPDRERHLDRDLVFSELSGKLYQQYRRHLGPLRYALLLQLQAALVPNNVRQMLSLASLPFFSFTLQAYGKINLPALRLLAYQMLVPADHLAEVKRLGQWQ